MEFKRSLLTKDSFFKRTSLREEEEASLPDPQEPPSQKPLNIEISKDEKVSEEFLQKCLKALVDVPPVIQDNLSKNGYFIGVSDTPKTFSESENPLSMLQSNYTDYSIKGIFVSEVILIEGNAVPNLSPEGSLRHALGHAIDALAPSFMETHVHRTFSESDSFQYAHSSDIARLSKENRAKLAYYADSTDEARSECFAEGLAALYGGGAAYTLDVMSKYFPAVMKRVKEISNTIESGETLSNIDKNKENQE